MTEPRFSQNAHVDAPMRSGHFLPGAPSRGPVTLILIDPAGPERLTAACSGTWTRVVARVLASTLDRRLARGCAPESHRLLATRALVLVSPATRDELVKNWTNLLRRARTDPTPRTPKSPLNRARVIACERDIAEMLEMIAAPRPIAARGVAMAADLLRDGTGPVYDRRPSADLAGAIRAVMALLDPSTLVHS
jgi:hypothetical protein